jgi:hypothetical protein
MRQARYAARAGTEEYCTHVICVNIERKRPLGGYMLMWEDNIKNDVEGKGCRVVHKRHLAKSMGGSVV